MGWGGERWYLIWGEVEKPDPGWGGVERGGERWYLLWGEVEKPDPGWGGVGWGGVGSAGTFSGVR